MAYIKPKKKKAKKKKRTNINKLLTPYILSLINQTKQ